MNFDHVRSRSFQLRRCSKRPPLSIRSINDFSCSCKRCSIYLCQWFESLAHFCFFSSSMVVTDSWNKNLSNIPIKRSHTESNQASLEARDSSLLFSSKCLEDTGLSTSEKQPQNKKEKHLVKISCVPGNFEVVEIHSNEILFCNSVP